MTANDDLSSGRAHLAPLNNQRILITGGHGMLARALREQLDSLVTGATIWSAPRTELDVRDLHAVLAARSFEPDVILHCAAHVDADFCESDPEAARRSIVQGSAHIVQLARETGARLLYPQSFLIYDGSQDPITEDTPAHPLSVYGHMKVEAEAHLLAQLPNALSVRMAGFFGGAEADTNFVGRIVPHLAKLVAQGVPSIDIGDRVWQPTFTRDLALNALALLAAGKTGVYCMAAHGEASFCELTVEIVRLMGWSDRLQVNRIDAAALASREKARRPLRAVIDNQRLRADGLDLQRTWQVALAEYLDTPYFRKMR